MFFAHSVAKKQSISHVLNSDERIILNTDLTEV